MIDQIGQLAVTELEQPNGVTCPCCTQLAKVYRRTITRDMAEDLIALSKLPAGYHHYKEFKNGSADLAKLAYWELIEAQPRDTSDNRKRSSGFWKITDKGIDFVLGIITVPMYARIYDARLLNFVGDQIGIKECLRAEFDFGELMAR